MSVTVMLGSGSREVGIRASPLAELCSCLHSVDELGHHPASRAWAGDFEAVADGQLASELRNWFPLWGPFRARYLLPLTDHHRRELDDELQDIADLALPEFVAMSAQALVGKSTSEPLRHLPDDAAAQKRFLARIRLISSHHLRLGHRLLTDAEQVRGELLAFLRSVVDTAYEAEWAKLRPIIDAEVRTKVHIRNRLGAGVLGDFPIATLLPDPPRVVFDKLYPATASLDDSPCLLVPSLHGNPHTVIKHYPGFPIVVQYPISAGRGDELSLDVMRKRLTVLDNPVRINLCQSILRRAASTTELAMRLEMTAPQVSRHLRRLREAGLVHGHREGAVVRYQLDTEAVHRLGLDFLQALHR
ncbi:winged helix-turn-helix transcriptional regulator [Saccharopolyspora erythraea]|uniref:ArsR/SmtB family transcription factor n=1 Tax=Saccharopolyspora erythraea TaxID=1836 RepID=UPI001BAD6AC4|nr:DUF5937 family protein [Saccharopolyspora erythraea]QUH02007.1 winged helix-turn-helix transcriptional regulator [Saccharopolyspora erythraea]